MPGNTPATSQLDWLSTTTAMIVLSWSKAARDLLKSFSWGIRALRQLFASDDGAISSPPAPYHLPVPRKTPGVFADVGSRSRRGGPRLRSCHAFHCFRTRVSFCRRCESIIASTSGPRELSPNFGDGLKDQAAAALA